MVKPLSAHEHSGKHLPHHHTSYAALVFLTVLAGLTLMLATRGVLADNPSTGQVNISATVNGVAPTTGPVITSPVNDQRFSAAPITVEGLCIADYKVVVYSNSVLAGSGICKSDGTFSIKIDLFDGRNELMARQYDFLDQASPDSAIVTVFFDRPPPALAPGVQKFVIRSSTPYKTVHFGDDLEWPIEVLGGTPPYAISWNWGDGSVDVISLTAPGGFIGKHVYAHPGTYRIIIKGTDSRGQTAYLELLVIVTGDLGGATSKNSGWFDGGLLLILWPLYFLMIAMLLSFWLGERYELYKVKQRLLGWRKDPYSGLKP